MAKEAVTMKEVMKVAKALCALDAKRADAAIQIYREFGSKVEGQPVTPAKKATWKGGTLPSSILPPT